MKNLDTNPKVNVINNIHLYKITADNANHANK